MLGPPRHSFFLIPPFQNLGLKVVPPAESVGKGGEAVTVQPPPPPIKYVEYIINYCNKTIFGQNIFLFDLITDLFVCFILQNGRLFFN